MNNKLSFSALPSFYENEIASLLIFHVLSTCSLSICVCLIEFRAYKHINIPLGLCVRIRFVVNCTDCLI